MAPNSGLPPRMALDERLHTASVFKWAKRLPPHGLRMADAWLSAIERRLARGPLSDACVALLKREMIADVRAQLEELASDAKVVRREALTAAWVEWYPKWVAGRLGELEQSSAELFVSEEAARRLQSKRDKAVDARSKRASVAAVAAKDLLAYVAASSGQVVRWEPEALALAIRPKAARGKRPDVLALASRLVNLGVAEWRERSNGKPWALAATGKPLD